MKLNRRELLQGAGLGFAASTTPNTAGADDTNAGTDWIRTCRGLICEAYNPPFYPSLDYQAAKAVNIAQQLNADSLRYPAASYFAYFPTKSGYPIHPELKGDPMRETADLCKQAGIKLIAYVPLNHPFMDASSKDPRYQEWCKRTLDGKPMTTEHYGYARYFEGCLNSPVRDVIRTLVREVLTQYPVDVMYFDGPYQGMQMAKEYCHCQHCDAAYRKRFGRGVPDQIAKLSREDEIQYTNWMAKEVVIAFLAEIRQMIRETRDVPTLFNDTSLLSKREWRNRAIPVVDGFMFEAAETPEDKLFNLQLGHSTGKTIWTYVGTHTQYNREHMRTDRVRGWFTYPVESQELLIDGATALAGGAGIVYWGLSRFFYMPESPLAYESGRYVKEVFDLSRKHQRLFAESKPLPAAGVLVSDQTIDWYVGRHYVSKGYENYYHGAWQILKDLGYDSEPFLDYLMTPAQLARYRMVWLPNAVCLSDAQCAMLRDYVHNGGILVATHLTSVAGEYGKVRANFGLGELFGAKYVNEEPVEIPDLYLRLPNGEEIPQDPQVFRFANSGDGKVLAETIDRGHRANLGPAIVQRTAGKGQVIYIGSGLDAVYAETRMKRLRTYFSSWIEPLLKQHRTYEIEWQSGVLPHLMSSPNTLLLHLLADTGNKFKKLRAREEFLPVENVKVRVRIPQGRTVKAVSLLRSGSVLNPTRQGDWIEATVPRVFIHEAVRVDLA
jgi:hypothetical protein